MRRHRAYFLVSNGGREGPLKYRNFDIAIRRAPGPRGEVICIRLGPVLFSVASGVGASNSLSPQ